MTDTNFSTTRCCEGADPSCDSKFQGKESQPPHGDEAHKRGSRTILRVEKAPSRRIDAFFCTIREKDIIDTMTSFHTPGMPGDKDSIYRQIKLPRHLDDNLAEAAALKGLSPSAYITDVTARSLWAREVYEQLLDNIARYEMEGDLLGGTPN